MGLPYKEGKGQRERGRGHPSGKGCEESKRGFKRSWAFISTGVTNYPPLTFPWLFPLPNGGGSIHTCLQLSINSVVTLRRGMNQGCVVDAEQLALPCCLNVGAGPADCGCRHHRRLVIGVMYV